MERNFLIHALLPAKLIQMHLKKEKKTVGTVNKIDITLIQQAELALMSVPFFLIQQILT